MRPLSRLKLGNCYSCSSPILMWNTVLEKETYFCKIKIKLIVFEFNSHVREEPMKLSSYILQGDNENNCKVWLMLFQREA